MNEIKKGKYILGISAFYHDSAAALLKNGSIISAAQEERFTRVKHDSSFPKNAINFILRSSNINISDIDYFVFYDKPLLKFHRLISTFLMNVPYGFTAFRKSISKWLSEKIFLQSLILKNLRKLGKDLKKEKLLFTEHHFSHAASAFYPSPFNDAIVLTLDGVGEWATSTVSIGKNNNLDIVKEIHFPSSLGLLYSAFTYYTGFKVLSGEYKLMGLAPYGKPIYSDIIKDKLINIKSDGSFRLNQKYFNYMTGNTMINKNFEDLFGKKRRKPGEKISEFHMNIASSIQKVTEDVVLLISNNLYDEYKIKNLCLAGGVALNCVANGKLLKQSKFENIWVQPAAGDAGGALGAAYATWYNELKNPRISNNEDKMFGSYLGPNYSTNEIRKTLNDLGAIFDEISENKIISRTAKVLADKKAVGWFQGKMEFGPRALGNRSILADPRSENMQKNLNLKVKFRESFRPFAPAILHEDLNDWFDINKKSPYMLLVANILNKHVRNLENKDSKLFGIDKLNLVRSNIPAVTHVDYSSRIQTVHEETNKKLYNLIKEFKYITGVPIIVNTSFNVRGEPIVCTPEDAFKCFMGTNIDVLVIGNFYLNKSEQNKNLLINYKDKFELD